MHGNRGRDTKPELAVRRLLHSSGFRYRVDYRAEQSVRTRPDIAFTKVRLAVFIDGCFWHGCPEHHTASATNAGYWSDKVDTNRERDRRNSASLEDRGWTVMRFWEHEDPEAVVAAIATTITALRGNLKKSGS
jgi:DNA mismatch endonuclease (patch repair protein)